MKKYCTNCGNKIKENDEYCAKCGKELNEKKTKKNNKKATWETSKLVISIISLVVCFFILIQSCAAGLVNSVDKNGSVSGTQGFICSVLMLIAGSVGIANRDETENGPSIACMILYFIAAFITIGSGSTYGDLPIWGAMCCGFGLTYAGSVLLQTKYFKKHEKDKWILIVAIITLSILFLILNIYS